jgi:uncharacterized membrane protein YebE (DUF533 family)
LNPLCRWRDVSPASWGEDRRVALNIFNPAGLERGGWRTYVPVLTASELEMKMFDAQKLLQQVLGGQQGDARSKSSGASGSSGGMISSDHIAGAAVGGLAGLLLGSKKARKIAGPVAQLGGLAAVGTLAFQAYQAWQAKQNGQTPPSATPEAEGTKFLPRNDTARNDLSLMVLSAMIAASKANGHIDAAEQDKIFARINENDLSADAKAYLMDQFRKPLTIPELAAYAKTPELAADLYTASVMAIQPDTATEVSYLNNLAGALNLDPGLRTNIETVVKSA